jgi:hypothetical protein
MPRTSPLARLQSVADSRVTSHFHNTVALNDLERAVLRLCDGAHTREDMLECLLRDIREGRLALHIHAVQPPSAAGETTIDVTPSPAPAWEPPSEESIRAGVSQLLDKCLFHLTQLALMSA